MFSNSLSFLYLYLDWVFHNVKLDYQCAKYSDLRLAFQIMSRKRALRSILVAGNYFPPLQARSLVFNWDSANSNFDKILNFLLGINHQSFQRGELWVILHRNPRALTEATPQRRFHWNLQSNRNLLKAISAKDLTLLKDHGSYHEENYIG